MAYRLEAALNFMARLAVPLLGVIFTRHVAALRLRVLFTNLLLQTRIRVGLRLGALVARADLKDLAPHPPPAGFGKGPELPLLG